MFLIYSKFTKELTYKSGRYFETNPTPDEIWNNLEYDSSTHTLYMLDEKHPIQFMVAERIANGDLFDPQWTGDEVTSITFDGEDAKGWLSITGDEGDIPQTSQGTNIVATVYLPDKVTVDTSFNGHIKIPITTPYNRIYMKAKFKDGVATHKFKPAAYGKYMIPEVTPGMHAGENNEFRIANAISFESIFEVV